MAEEQRCQEDHRRCANNCGFFGNPGTHNLCSKCYRSSVAKRAAVEKTLSAVAAAITTSSPSPSAMVPETSEEGRIQVPAEAPESRQPSRCGTCQRRVGLTGFKCRCGLTFCGGHRYPEKHGCAFDYKAAGRDAIAKANPLVVADKLLHKI